MTNPSKSGLFTDVQDIYNEALQTCGFKNFITGLKESPLIPESLNQEENEEATEKDKKDFLKRNLENQFKEKKKIDLKKEEKNKFSEKDFENKNLNDFYNKYLKIIRDENNKLLLNYIEKEKEENIFQLSKKNENPQVFLSYSVKDVLIAVALYFIFSEKYKIFLYVDYLFNDSATNVKGVLANEMDKSKQFLLVDASNAMVSIDSKSYIRPWCFWEHGYFLKKDGFTNVTQESKNSFRLGFAQFSGQSANSEILSHLKILNFINSKKGLVN